MKVQRVRVKFLTKKFSVLISIKGSKSKNRPISGLVFLDIFFFYFKLTESLRSEKTACHETGPEVNRYSSRSQPFRGQNCW